MSVYFYYSEERRAVRLGWSSDPKRKFKNNKNLFIYPTTDKSMEKFFRKKFMEEHRGGEWFSGPKIMEYVRSVWRLSTDDYKKRQSMERCIRSISTPKNNRTRCAIQKLLQLVWHYPKTALEVMPNEEEQDKRLDLDKFSVLFLMLCDMWDCGKSDSVLSGNLFHRGVGFDWLGDKCGHCSGEGCKIACMSKHCPCGTGLLDLRMSDSELEKLYKILIDEQNKPPTKTAGINHPKTP